MKQLFGTNGIREKVTEGIDCEFAMRLGRAVVEMQKKDKVKIVVGRDLRTTSKILEQALVCGINSVGADAFLIGEVSTPITAFAIKQLKADCAIMITAGHNDGTYNGFKIFNGSGFVLPYEQESFIEYFLNNEDEFETKKIKKLGKSIKKSKIIENYCDYLIKNIKIPIKVDEICVDCRNNISKKIIPKVLNKLNVKYKLINTQNNKCDIFSQMKNCKYDFAVCFSEDMARVKFFVSDKEIESEKIASMFSKKYESVACGKNNNLMLEQHLKLNNIEYVETDKYGECALTETMLANNISFGFENCGHFVFLPESSTSDGAMALMKLIEHLSGESRTLDELVDAIKLYPSKFLKFNYDEIENKLGTIEFKNSMFLCESTLSDSGRILTRRSRTDGSMTFFIEASNQSVVNGVSNELVKVLE